MTDEANDAATFDWHGLSITIAPAGHEGSNSNVTTSGYRGGGTYQAATGIAYRALYAMLAGYQDLTIGEAEMFGKALEALRVTEDKHNPPPTIEPGPGITPKAGAWHGTLASKYHVRTTKADDSSFALELEIGPEWVPAGVFSNSVPVASLVPELDALYAEHRQKKAAR